MRGTGWQNIIGVLDSFFEKPETLGSATPAEWYGRLKGCGMNPRPLGKGNLEGLPFENGGAYRVHWGGDKYFQYHPAGLNHHADAEYYKLSSGATGKRRYDMTGKPLRF